MTFYKIDNLRFYREKYKFKTLANDLDGDGRAEIIATSTGVCHGDI
ncbi:hypothetical protein J7K43_00570 [Candidatus Calescamantes bacterium]|nr:hypothetical protein [Candidatus Calescamantes bacterium]